MTINGINKFVKRSGAVDGELYISIQSEQNIL